MWNSNSIRNIGLAAAIVALTASGAARADDISATRLVSTHGLDLTSSGDQVKLRRQISKAARAVCAEVTDGMNSADADYRDCVREAFAGAWRQAETKIASANSRALLASAAPK
jgi:UrcA family protein